MAQLPRQDRNSLKVKAYQMLAFCGFTLLILLCDVDAHVFFFNRVRLGKRPLQGPCLSHRSDRHHLLPCQQIQGRTCADHVSSEDGQRVRGQHDAPDGVTNRTLEKQEYIYTNRVEVKELKECDFCRILLRFYVVDCIQVRSLHILSHFLNR